MHAPSQPTIPPAWVAWVACFAFIFLLLIHLGSAKAHAQTGARQIEGVSTESNIKAAYLYKFLSYVEWPATSARTATAPIKIGVVDDNQIFSELREITAGRQVNGRPIEVIQISPREISAGLHMLYVGEASQINFTNLLKAAQQHSILTVTDREDALELGSIINFRSIDGRVRFEIAIDSAQRSNLRINARMVNVAYHVHKG